jgi:hypothetical protein
MKFRTDDKITPVTSDGSFHFIIIGIDTINRNYKVTYPKQTTVNLWSCSVTDSLYELVEIFESPLFKAMEE